MDFKTALTQGNILILDGGYGSSFQAMGLTEAHYRNAALAGHPVALKGNHDLLCLTHPEAVEKIHKAYIDAGAQIIKTNSFNASAISQGDYQLGHLSGAITQAAAKLARRVADGAPHKVWVAGDIGPTNKTLTLSPDVARPGYRAVTFDEVEAGYYTQVAALDEGGVDLILIETIFDTLNAKAALHAFERYYSQPGKVRKGLWISATITDKSGRTLSGQTLEAFYNSIEHARPDVVGLNCALGAAEMLPYLRELNRHCAYGMGCHPNAGLPNALGGYDDTPESMAAIARTMAQEGLLNAMGGCCGTTPKHIAAIAAAVKGIPARKAKVARASLRLSGLEPLEVAREGAAFILVGERTNVTGSPKFAKLVKAGDLAGAVAVAAEQVRSGANLLDVNFDEGLLDSAALMRDYLNLLAAEPEIARVPLMIDSSKLEVIEAGLKAAQGKCVVNSISLKNGEAEFIAAARMLRRYGAAAIVMAFDERGQATDVARRVEIAKRAYGLLLAEGWAADDIIFDLNILTIGTGIAEHATYAADFITAIPLVKAACPGAKISGGVSNLSFAFRGQNAVREALHTVFLYHAINAGLDMAIVNAGMIKPFEALEGQLRGLCEDLIFNKSPQATDAMLAWAAKHAGDATVAVAVQADWRKEPLEARMHYALLNGVGDHVKEDAAQAMAQYGVPLKIIEGPLMDGMRHVGDLFGEGKMFLPQVVKSARVMKAFVAQLEPYLKAGDARKQGKILLATVKGDVHDIGKNIVGVVLGCNNYEVIDLGVMISCEAIIKAVREHKPDMVGLSGLITPSLHEMAYNATEFEKAGITVPLLIGGATTSKLHTALKIDPNYTGSVVWVPDASRVVEVCQKLLSPTLRAAYGAAVKAEYAQLRTEYAARQTTPLVPLEQARKMAPVVAPQPRVPAKYGVEGLTLSVEKLREYIDWSPFFWAWGMKGLYPKILANGEAQKLFDDAQVALNKLAASGAVQVRAALGVWPAKRVGDDVALVGTPHVFHFLRQQRIGQSTRTEYACLADYISAQEADSMGGFVVSATEAIDKLAQVEKDKGDDYTAIIIKALGDRLAEAAAEYCHSLMRERWGQGQKLSVQELIDEKYEGIRPASGYPSCPDHTEKALLWELLEAEKHTGARLTATYAMSPASTVSGLYFHHKQARYFMIGQIGADQLADYAARKGWSLEEAKRWLATLV